MLQKIYPRSKDKETVYLKSVITNPNIIVGDYTMYNDFEIQKEKSKEEKSMTQSNNQKQGNFFIKLFDRVKKIFGRNKTKMLTESSEMKQTMDNVTSTNKSQRESFVEDLQSRASNPAPIRRTIRNGMKQENDRLSNLNPQRQNDEDLEL